MTHNGRKPREQTAAQLAAEAMAFADGLGDAGQLRAARKLRALARETLWLVGALEDERSARVALQAARDRLLTMPDKATV